MKTTVVELFAGVGGFRLGLEGVPGQRETSVFEVIWSNQWEPSQKVQWASKVYEKRFGADNHSNEDINAALKSIPNHDLLASLLKVGISKGRSRANVSKDIPSEWASIEGHQGVRFSIKTKHDPWVQKFNGVLRLISKIMGWEINMPQRITKVISGKAQPEYPDRILRNSNLDTWMQENKVFSHAITFRNTIRYTTDINL